MSFFLRVFGVFALLSGMAVSTVEAHDLYAPDWRGEMGTAYAHWQFDTNANPAVPEELSNPFGSAEAVITLGTYASGWLMTLPSFGTQTGFWDVGVGGSIAITVDGPAHPVERKEVLVQVAYWEDLHAAPAVIVNSPTASLQSEQTAVIEYGQNGGVWKLNQSVWMIEPSFMQEQVVFTASAWGAAIDQIVIDTRVEPQCNDPFADTDGDGDVDQSDFGIYQLCVTGIDGGVPDGCACFDREDSGEGDGDIDLDDLDAFNLCASGPGVLADPACDG